MGNCRRAAELCGVAACEALDCAEAPLNELALLSILGDSTFLGRGPNAVGESTNAPASQVVCSGLWKRGQIRLADEDTDAPAMPG